MEQTHSPASILIPVSIATAFSLLGDASLYAILPTHVDEAGVALVGVGLLLSANRWIRLLSNGVVGSLLDRFSRKWIFVTAIFAGALSTLLYALTPSYWLFVASRALWGIAWSGIWIAGNALVLAAGDQSKRGRYVGFYNVAYVAGAATGSLVGGVLVDQVGYANTLLIEAGLQFLGGAAALWLPNVRIVSAEKSPTSEAAATPAAPLPLRRLAPVFALLGVSRLVLSGIIVPTFALFIVERFGEMVAVFGRNVGASTLTGFTLSLTTYLGLFAVTFSGELSDRWRSRWHVALIGLLLSVLGALILALAPSFLAILGLILVSVSASSNNSLATMLIGDLIDLRRQGSRLGWLFNIGDFASAAGPLLVFQLLDVVPITSLYLSGAALFAIMTIVVYREIQCIEAYRDQPNYLS